MSLPSQLRLGVNTPVATLEAVVLQIAADNGYSATSGVLAVTSGHTGGFALWNPGTNTRWAFVYGLQISLSAPGTVQIAQVTADPTYGALTVFPKRARLGSGDVSSGASLSAEATANVASLPTAFTDTYVMPTGIYNVPVPSVYAVLPPGTGLVVLAGTAALSMAVNADWVELGTIGQ